MAGFGDRHRPFSVIAIRRFRRSPWAETRIRDHLSDVNRTWDAEILKNTPPVQPADAPDGWADWEGREQALPMARAAFATIAGDESLGDFFRKAVKEIHHQQIVSLLKTLAEALLITLVTGAGAAAIGRAAAMLVADAGTLTALTVDVAVNASLNTMVQMAMSGDGNASFGWTMLENGLMDVFTRGLLRPMKAAENAARFEAEQIAALPNLTAAERRAVSSVNFIGRQAVTELVGGMAAQWAAQKIVETAKGQLGANGPGEQGVSDSFALTAVQQGAAIGLGKFFHGRLAAWETHRAQLERTPLGALPEARALFAAREEFFKQAALLESNPSPDPADAERLNQQDLALFKQERTLFEQHGVAPGVTASEKSNAGTTSEAAEKNVPSSANEQGSADAAADRSRVSPSADAGLASQQLHRNRCVNPTWRGLA
jgi:hypothetical protein